MNSCSNIKQKGRVVRMNVSTDRQHFYVKLYQIETWQIYSFRNLLSSSYTHICDREDVTFSFFNNFIHHKLNHWYTVIQQRSERFLSVFSTLCIQFLQISCPVTQPSLVCLPIMNIYKVNQKKVLSFDQTINVSTEVKGYQREHKDASKATV